MRVSMLILLCSLAGCADMLPFSGGPLAGTVVAAPADWTQVELAEVVQLETRPQDPYSVNIWVVGESSHLYVFAGASRSNWVDHIAANADVRLRNSSTIYELRASRITDAAEFVQFADLWEAKYGRRPFNENVDETFLFKLQPRD